MQSSPTRRRVRLALAAASGVVAVAGVTLVATNSASAATVDTNATYVIVNHNSGKVIDVYNWATNDGAPVNQWSRNDLTVQQWKFVDAGSGYYKIKSVMSGKVLDLPNATDGLQLVQNADSGSTTQHFRLQDSASGYVRSGWMRPARIGRRVRRGVRSSVRWVPTDRRPSISSS